ncbi:MAG: metallophosphoesterase [Bryobacterales bacterium]|nr:metallophosphoesterase [Bryobacterales bacterium]
MNRVIFGLLVALAGLTVAQRGPTVAPLELSQILGRPTDRTVTLSVFVPEDMEVFVEYGRRKSNPLAASVEKPVEFLLDGLQPSTRYSYWLHTRKKGQASFVRGDECSFHTQRAPGDTFVFGVQGDSHPERLNRMYHPGLYRRTMHNVAASRPDFYFMLGDDFSVEHLYNRDDLNLRTVGGLYRNQRNFLGPMARSTPLFLVNGNHEQAARHLLNGKEDSVPVIVGKSRIAWFPLPAPDGFYSGNTEPVEFVGLPRDYYAFAWGGALFVVIDPYWHSPVRIDAGIGGKQSKDGNRGRKGGRRGDGWAATMGDAQYQWLKRTLEQSTAKFKFVFAHHVLGTGRGAVELADLYEWGGKNRNGEWEFDKRRPGWAMPVHQLFVKHGVSIFFQGHDHLFARQEKDGVIYQETPNPADSGYQAFNREAYRSGDVLPNSGYLRVTVSPREAKVDYVRTWLAKDETAQHPNAEVAFSYTVRPRP